MPHQNEPIAIVGMAALMPKSPNLATYWQNITTSFDCISDLPKDHSWKSEEYLNPDPKARDKIWCSRGGFIDNVPFDPLVYGVPPNALDATDTTQLLSLIVAREALKDAGLDPDSNDWSRERVACILGVTGTQELAITLGARLQGPTWRKSLLRCGVDPVLADAVVDDISNHFPEWKEQSFPGLLGNVISGRISNRLDLGGTNCVVDAACASSLAAVQLAMADLQLGRSDIALTGGADTLNDIFMYMCFSKTPALSKSGEARPFDKNADGILISEGVGVIAMKRLSDAERDGDRIYAVIKGIGSSSDGRSGSIYAPNPAGQASAINRAYQDAGFDLDTIGLIEAHGTGTTAGDAAEVKGLQSVFGATGSRKIAMGSVKSQIGHTKSAAGTAGLIKAALSLYHRALPPTTKIRELAPALTDGPLYANTEIRPWIHAGEHPRRAGVSAFGFGGSNFHIALEEHQGSVPTSTIYPTTSALFVVGSDSASELKSTLKNLALDCESATSVHHFSHQLLRDWAPKPHRIGFVAADLDQVKSALALAAGLLESGAGTKDGVTYGVVNAQNAKIGVIFPGQGSQYVNMGSELALTYRSVRETLDQADALMLAAGREPLSAVMFPAPEPTKEQQAEQSKKLRATQWAQPALGAVEAGMFKLLSDLGLTPAATAGHSFGELVALHAAGVWSFETMFTAARLRGEAMAADGKDRGTMAAISAPLKELEAALADIETDVVLANRNHPRQGVIAGSVEAVESTLAQLKERSIAGRRIPVSAAFHSPLVADAAGPFNDAIRDLEFTATSTPVYANASAQKYPADADGCRALLASQITATVIWDGLIRQMYEDGIRTFVECGPKSVLNGLVKRILRKDEDVSVISLDASSPLDADGKLKSMLAQLTCRGLELNVSPLLDQALPIPAREAGSKATVWIGGANFRKEETKSPAAPTGLPVVQPQVTVLPASPVIAPPQPVLAPPQPEVAAALEMTRSSLLAFQAAQERIAQAHTDFLNAHARANENFATLFQTHANLVQKLTGQVPAQVTALPTVVTATPMTAPVDAVEALTHSFLANDATAQQSDFYAAMPSVAEEDDLPPIMSADSMGSTAAKAQASPVTPTAVTQTPDLDITAALLATIANKTGYPVDMLELSMDLENDLGVDSIKRVEIMAAVQDKLPDLPEISNDLLSTLRTIQEVANALLEAAPSMSAPPVTSPIGNADEVTKTLLSVVADKTGYPIDMLELSMDLENDLGVDSIKRVEIMAAVQDQLSGLPEVDNEVLSTLRTLQEISDILCVSSGQPTDSTVTSSSPDVTSSDPDVTSSLISIIADKTGYPTDMLDLSMDLENDLGVDSIKRVEIMAALQTANPTLPEIDNELLSSLRTIAEIIDTLSRSSGPVTAKTAPTLSLAQDPTESTLPPRRVVELAATTRTGPLHINGPVVVTASASDLAADVVVSLKELGVDATLLNTASMSDEELATAISKETNCLIHMEAVGRSGQPATHAIRAGFLLAKSNPHLTYFVGVSGRGGSFARGESATGDPIQSAIGGLTKTLAHEREGLYVTFDIDEKISPKLFADALVCRWHRPEVGLSATGEAVTLVETETAVEQKEKDSLLSEGDLVVVSGGARGVTAAVVGEMANRFKPSLLLLGRSALTDSDPDWALGVADDDLIGVYIQSRTQKVTPKEADTATRKVMSSREVRDNIASIRASGSAVMYRAVDVRDKNQVASAISDATSKFGPVQGIVHAAGIIADKLVTDKTIAQFDSVFATKVDGLISLIDALETGSTLKLLAVFSSVAGRFGNLGQCDYAMANEAITAIALNTPNVDMVRSFDWGPWEGGMVTPSIKRALQARGLALIGLKAGATFFCDELESCDHTAMEVVLGGPLVSGPTPPDGDLRGSKRINLIPDRDGFLSNHRIDHKAVLPAMMVLEWMASAASEVAPSLRVAAIRDFSVVRGVVVEEATDVDLHWSRDEDDDFKLNFELRDPTRDGPFGLLYKAQIEMTSTLKAPAKFPGSNGLSAARYPYDVDEAYAQFLFHGPAFRGITNVVGLSDHGIVANIQTSTPSTLGQKGNYWVTDPVTLDSVLQLMVLWVRETRGISALPSHIGEYKQYAPIRGIVSCHMRFEPTSSAQGRFRATIVDAEDRVVALLDEAEFTAKESLNKHFKSAAV